MRVPDWIYKEAQDVFPKGNEMTLNAHLEEWKANTKTNIEIFGIEGIKARSFQFLSGKHPSRTTVVCGAGPSLVNALPELRTGRFMVMAIDRTAKYLNDNGVKVDFVISADPEFQGNARLNCPLIASVWSSPQLVGDWPGDVYFYIPLLEPLELCQQFKDMLNGFNVGVGIAGSTVGAGMMTSVIMGCNPVIFAGCDFALLGDYADGGKSEAGKRGEAVAWTDIHGKEVMTYPDYLLHAVNIGMFCDKISAEHGIKFYNASGQGILGAFPEGVLDSIKQINLKEV